MKKILFAVTIIAIIVIITNSYAELYPSCGIVYQIDIEKDLVYVKDCNNFLWCFYGVEDWKINDFAAIIFDDAGTSIIFDDIIVRIQYCGHISDFMFF